MKIILFCPVREHPEILRESLDSHRNLEGISARWYVDDSVGELEPSTMLIQATGPVLADRCIRWSEADAPYARNEQGHHWHPASMSKMARIRDYGMRLFLASDADALFTLDSDLLPHPHLVKHLAGLNLPIVSEVFWTKWKPEGEPYAPNVWDWHNYGFNSVDSFTRLRNPGVYKVGGLGACTLIRREAFEKGVRWEPVPGCDFWPGEDRHFCIRAAAVGLPLHADTHYPPFHIYRMKQLHSAGYWRRGPGGSVAEEPACNPAYFRDRWLSGDWPEQVRKYLGGTVSA